MPAKRYDITLGFIGSGEVSEKNFKALLKDLIQAHGKTAKFIVPMTTEHWTDTLASITEYAEEKDYAIEAVVDGDTKGAKKHLPLARKEHKAEDVPTALVNLLDSAPGAKLIVLWEDDDETVEEAVVLADEKDIEALDLTSGLDVIELEPDDEGSEPDEEEPDEEPEEEALSKKDLLKLAKTPKGEEQLDEMATELGIDVESLDSWEDVAEAIFEHQEGGGDAPDGDGDDEVITAEKVEAMDDFKELKALAKELGVEVPPRTKSPGYKKAILEHLGEKAEGESEPEEEPERPSRKQRRLADEVEETSDTVVVAADLASALFRLAEVLDRIEEKLPTPRQPKEMTEEEAQEIVDAYEKKGRRRGRPPAEVTDARRLLGID